MAHEGKSIHRLKREPLEKQYHDAWKEKQQHGDLLQWLLGDGTSKAHDVTERDEMVAATVIQWLGSPVGQSFVQDVLDSVDK